MRISIFFPEAESWIVEKLQTALDECYKDPSNLDSKVQKHQAFEAELTAHRGVIDAVQRNGEELISSGHFAASEVESRIESLYIQWEELLEASDKKARKLEEARDHKKFNQEVDIADSCIADKVKESSVRPSLPPSLPPFFPPFFLPSLSPSLCPSVRASVPPSAHPSLSPRVLPYLPLYACPTLPHSIPPSARPSLRPLVSPSLTPSLRPRVPPSLRKRVLPSLASSACHSALTPPLLPRSIRASLPSSLRPHVPPSLSPTNLPFIDLFIHLSTHSYVHFSHLPISHSSILALAIQFPTKILPILLLSR